MSSILPTYELERQGRHMIKLIFVRFTLMVPVMILRGFVLTILWRWFVVYTFHIPGLSLGAGIGICIIYGLITGSIEEGSKSKRDNRRLNKMGLSRDAISALEQTMRESNEKFRTHNVAVVLTPLFALLFGWIVHLFM